MPNLTADSEAWSHQSFFISIHRRELTIVSLSYQNYQPRLTTRKETLMISIACHMHNIEHVVQP